MWPENWPSVQAFMRVRTQWRVGAAGATGLDYGSVLDTLRVAGVEPLAEIFEDLQVMEAEIIHAWGQERERRNRR